VPIIPANTIWVSWYQKGKTKTNLEFLEQEIVSGSGNSWTICKSTPRSSQRAMPAPHHSVFTGWMPFLQPNQLVEKENEGNRADLVHLKKESTALEQKCWWCLSY